MKIRKTNEIPIVGDIGRGQRIDSDDGNSVHIYYMMVKDQLPGVQANKRLLCCCHVKLKTRHGQKFLSKLYVYKNYIGIHPRVKKEVIS